MANVQLFARKNQLENLGKAPGIGTGFYQIDLSESEPIKVTMSVQDFEDPTKVASVFSKTFKVPHTPRNGQYFRAAFNVNSTDFDISKKADAYILNDGLLFSSGNIRLTSITVNGAEGNIEYEVTFFGNTSDFASKVGGGFLNDLDFVTEDPDRPEFNLSHYRTYSNVTSSWNKTFLGGNVIYGLVEWGYDYTEDNQPDDTTLSFGFLKSFDDSSNPLWLEQLKPMLRAKIVWDKIFYDAGYTYESDFLSSERFTNLYLLSETEARSTLPVNATFRAVGNMPAFEVSPTQVTGQEYKATCTIEEIDAMDAYDNASTFEYVAQSTSIHKFTIKAKYTLQALPGGSTPTAVNNQFRLWLMNSRTGLCAFDWVTVNSVTGEVGPSVFSVSLQKGDKVTMWLSAIVPVMSGPFAVTFHNLLFSCTDTGVLPLVNVSAVLPKTVKKVEFIKSIITKFKLVFTPSKDRANHFKIEPWNVWVRSGGTVDWTLKLDSSKSITVRPLFDNQKRKVTFTEQADNDYLNDSYQKANDNQVFGQLVLDSSIDLITGDETYSTVFAPSVIAPIAGEEVPLYNPKKFLIPHAAKDTGGAEGDGTNVNSGKRQPIVPKMRLFYYNGIKPSYVDWYIARADNGASPIPFSSHPFFSNFTTWPVTPETFDINWKNQLPLWDTSIANQTEWSTTYTAYSVYWKDWYQMTYDPYSRIVEATFVLDYSDLSEFEFNDLVFVKDAWYFVNEIKDYVVGEKTACKVTLVKIGSDISLNLNVVEPEVLDQLNLCYSSSSYCKAYCCCRNTNTCATYSTYYGDGDTFTSSQNLYTDPYGSTPAVPGYYSDGSKACTVGDNGMILSFHNTAVCDCGSITTYPFVVVYAKEPCPTFGDIVPITIYGEAESYYDNRYFYLDSSRTVTVPFGYYREKADTDFAVRVSTVGQVIGIYPLADCYTPTLHKYTANYSTVECDSCCTLDSRTIYTDSATFSSSTVAYSDNTGTSDAAVGYYEVGEKIMYVNPAGTVDSFTDCSACSPCPDGTVSVTVCVFQNLEDYKTVGKLYTSADNSTWKLVGDVVVTSVDPLGTPTCQEFLVDPNIHAKVVFGTDVREGKLNIYLEEDGEQTAYFQYETPGAYTFYFPTVLKDGIDYVVSGIVLDGTAGDIDYYAQSLWFSDNEADPCASFCHVGLTASTYYGDNLTLATSTYLYDDALGATPAAKGWYSDGVVLRQVGEYGLIIEEGNVSVCSCGGQQTELYEYSVIYDASVACTACDVNVGTQETVYGTEPTIQDCKLFYQYGPSGLELASAGFYAVNNYWFELGADGVIVDFGRCEDDCTITPYYATYYVVNRTRATVTYSYAGQSGLSYSGTIASGGYIITQCMDLLTLYVSGYCEVTEIAECAS